MIIIGHEDIPFRPLYYVDGIEEIENTPAGSTLLLGPFGESKEIARHCYENGLRYAVTAESLKEALFANALNAEYILCSFELAPSIQKIAENYLFDAKIVVPVNDENELEAVAEEGIDGVIFKEAVIA